MIDNQQRTLITGASAGIGEALAWQFAGHGHDLILVARSVDKLEALADALTTEHAVSVAVYPADLSKRGAAGKLFRALRGDGLATDILVNNAGVLQHGRFVEMSPAEHQRIVQLNTASLSDMLAWFVPPMVERGAGRILNVASVAAFQPVPSLATYAATKAFVLSLSEALGEELSGSGVTVTALCPGLTDTNMVAQVKASSEGAKKFPDMLISDVEDVAREGFEACLAGTPVAVPGRFNQATVLATRALPRWLVRRMMGAAGRASY
jgi:short-subunit dehydrogenase